MKNGNNSTTTTTTTTRNPGITTNDLIMAQTMLVRSFGPKASFFFFVFFFLILNNIDSYFRYIEAMEGLKEGSSEENGPKQRDMRHLGHLVSSFSFSLCFLYTNHHSKALEATILQRDAQETMKRKTNRIVWATSTCSFFLLVFFLYTNHISTTTIGINKLRRTYRKVQQGERAQMM